jgi:alcohol dehydrogenase
MKEGVAVALDMLAAVLFEQGRPSPFAESKPLQIETVTLDPPGPGEVLVKMAAAGLCHSDLSAIQGNRPRAVPAVPGHEGAGTVIETGPGVTGLKAGDHVVTLFVSSCGHCRYCLAGRRNLCESSWTARSTGTLPGGARRLHLNGKDLNHWSGVSTFAEYTVTDQSSLVKVDSSIPLPTAAVLGCSVVTGVGAVMNSAQVRPGNSVAVLGLGGVGLSAVMGAVLSGASEIIAIDIAEHKLSLASDLGATMSIDARDPDLVEKIGDATNGGVDFAFEMSGVDASVANAYAITSRGGSVVMASLPNPSKVFPLPLAAHVAAGRRFMGSYMGDSWAQRDIPLYADLFLSGKLPIDRLQSSQLPLQSINEGFDRLARGEAVRDVITF